MKYLLMPLFLLSTTFLIAQKQMTWIGGTPGKENTWEEPKNWNTNDIPDADTHVIIKKGNTGHLAQPIIKNRVLIAALEIQSGAELNIESTGQLVIDGGLTYSEGITIYGGKIQSEGEIILKNIEEQFTHKSEAIVTATAVKYYHAKYGFEFSIVQAK